MTLGDIIKDYRKAHGVTMEYVANLCGITKGYVAMLERNINSKTGKPVKPTIETILKVCEGLRLDVNDIFSQLDDDYMITLPTTSEDFSQSETKLLELYRTLNDEGQERLVEYADDLVSSGKYIKNSAAELVAE